MRLFTLLETPKDEAQLQQIADTLTAAVFNATDREHDEREVGRGSMLSHRYKSVKPEDDHLTPDIHVGTIHQLMKSEGKSLGYLFNRLGATKVRVSFNQNTNAAGEFNSYFNELSISVPMTYGNNGKRKTSDPRVRDEVASIMVHELRHGLDSSLSKKKAVRKSRGTWVKKTDDEHARPAGELNYLSRPHEINARFAEVLKTIPPYIDSMHKQGKQPDRNVFIRTWLPRQLDKFQLADIFKTKDEFQNTLRQSGGTLFGQPVPQQAFDNKMYQQLLKRALKQFDYEIAKNKQR